MRHRPRQSLFPKAIPMSNPIPPQITAPPIRQRRRCLTEPAQPQQVFGIAPCAFDFQPFDLDDGKRMFRRFHAMFGAPERKLYWSQLVFSQGQRFSGRSPGRRIRELEFCAMHRATPFTTIRGRRAAQGQLGAQTHNFIAHAKRSGACLYEGRTALFGIEETARSLRRA